MSRLYLTRLELRELLGETGAAQVCAALGGLSNVYVPKYVRPESTLAKAIGMAMAEQLAKEYGGEYIELPTGHAMRTKALEIRALLGKGLSAPVIARTVGVTERYVRIVAAGQPADPRQPGLFDAA